MKGFAKRLLVNWGFILGNCKLSYKFSFDDFRFKYEKKNLVKDFWEFWLITNIENSEIKRKTITEKIESIWQSFVWCHFEILSWALIFLSMTLGSNMKIKCSHLQIIKVGPSSLDLLEPKRRYIFVCSL